MFTPNIIERVYHWLDTKTQKLFANRWKRQLNNTDFTIISNNCWGGVAYEHFGLQKQSPTIGAYFFAEDYLEFIANLKRYMQMEIKIISVDESKHKVAIKKNKTPNAIVGVLSDSSELQPIEIVFLHYKNPEIVIDKWNRRKQRINYNNLIFKFSLQNECTEKHIELFEKMNLPGKKFMFINRLEEVNKYSCAVYYPGFELNSQIENDTFYWNKYFDVVKFINTGIIS